MLEWSPEIEISAVISLLGILWAISAYIISHGFAKQKQVLEYINFISQYNDRLRSWGNEVVDLMSNAGHLCDLDPSKDPEFFGKIHNYKIKMSALIDQGRFFLPNKGIDKFGQHKPSAYRGFSSDSIKSMKNIYDLLFKLNWYDQEPNKTLRVEFMNEKRKFVSFIQDEIDPEKFEREFRTILMNKVKTIEKFTSKKNI